jgi:hypothetical protein
MRCAYRYHARPGAQHPLANTDQPAYIVGDQGLLVLRDFRENRHRPKTHKSFPR